MNETFYNGLLEWDLVKGTNVFVHIVNLVVAPCLLYTIVW
jgi:hypothetical protein